MLKEIMKERRISQAKLSRIANINSSQFNRAYNGHQPFFKGWKLRISEVLNIPESELFPIHENKEEENE